MQLTARLSELSPQVSSPSSPSLHTPVVMVGDFNVCSDEFGQALDGGAEYTAMTNAFSAAGLSMNLVKPGSGLASVREEFVEDAPAGVVRQSLDHVFVSAALEKT